MKYLVLIPLLLLTAVLPISADTIVLKDGTKYEGTILKEDATHYEMRVQVTATIRDLKRIPKDTVASATRSTPDDKAFEAIAKILPVPDRQTTIRYDEFIKGQVQPFLKAFPKSKHRKKAEEILAALEKERARVARGDLKLDGRWITAQDREANAYEIDARIAFSDMEDAAEAGRYKEALRGYELIKSDYANTSYYEKAIELARKVLQTYGSTVRSSLSRVDVEIARREAEMERLPEAQRKAALAEIARQDAAYEALVEKEKSELKTRWLTLNTYHKKPMEVVQRNISTVTQELDRVDLAKITDAAPLYRKAWAAVTSGSEDEIKEALRELKSARIPARYVEGLEQRVAAAEAAKIAAEETAKAEEAARKAAEAAAAEEEEKMAEEAAEAKKAAEDADKSAETGSGTEPATAAAGDEGGGINIKTVLVFVMIAVLLVALGAMLLGKKKS